MPISAVDTVGLALEHTKRQLFRPFRFGQWVRLAFVGLLAGELGGGGNFNLPHSPQGTVPSWGGFPKIDPAILASVITVLVITGFVVFLVLTYISSVMRFILFDGVLTREIHIGAGWTRRQGNGWHYFLWQLILALATFAGFVLLIVLPAAFAFGMGWFTPPRAHVVQLVLTGIVVVALFVIYMIAIAVIHVFTKDFIIPQMALEGITAFEGWRRLWPMIKAEQKGYVVYVVLKIVLSIVAAIAIGIVTAIFAVIFAVPVIGVVATAVLATRRSTDLERTDDYYRSDCGMHPAGDLFLPGVFDYGSGDRFLPSVSDYCFSNSAPAVSACQLSLSTHRLCVCVCVCVVVALLLWFVNLTRR